VKLKTGPKYIDFDFALVKNTRLTERANLQFRGEFFNLFNNVNFTSPIAALPCFLPTLPGISAKNCPPNCLSVASRALPAMFLCRSILRPDILGVLSAPDSTGTQAPILDSGKFLAINRRSVSAPNRAPLTIFASKKKEQWDA
jgi:hypothetical protein